MLLLPVSAGAQVYGFPSSVGVVDDGFGTLPPAPPPFPPNFGAAAPPPFASPPPTPAPCPLILKVGRGLRHPVTTRVIYGHPSPCS